jgi:hypothetical protein
MSDRDVSADGSSWSLPSAPAGTRRRQPLPRRPPARRPAARWVCPRRRSRRVRPGPGTPCRCRPGCCRSARPPGRRRRPAAGRSPVRCPRGSGHQCRLAGQCRHGALLVVVGSALWGGGERPGGRWWLRCRGCCLLMGHLRLRGSVGGWWVQHAAPPPGGLGRARRLHGRRRTAQAAWVAAPGGRTRAWRTPGLLAARESRCCAGPGRPAGQRRGRQRPRSPPAGPAGPVLAAGVEGQGGLGRGQPPGAGGRRPLRRGAHPPAGAAAPGIGCGEPCWCGPTAWSPGAASAPPPTHHPAGGVRRALVRAPASVPRPRRRCASFRKVFALVQAPRGVGAACCAHQPATGSHATGGATSERATSRYRGHRPAAGCRPPDLASQRLLSVQLDQPAAVARLLRTIPEQ